MSEHTKELPIEIKFVGPRGNKAKAIDALKFLGFVDASNTIPWRDLFPGIKMKSSRESVFAGVSLFFLIIRSCQLILTKMGHGKISRHLLRECLVPKKFRPEGLGVSGMSHRGRPGEPLLKLTTQRS